MARGRRDAQVSMLAFVDLHERVPVDHPLRPIKRMADAALAKLSPVFDEMYADSGRPSIPPERLLKAHLLISLFTIRSERAFCEDLDFTMRYRWFLEMTLMEPSFAPATFRKNRERLIEHDVARRCFDQVLGEAKGMGLLSDEHFTIDGTLIEAAASQKSFVRKDGETSAATPVDDPGNPTVDFHGEKRPNVTHASTTDADARHIKKGKALSGQASRAAAYYG